MKVAIFSTKPYDQTFLAAANTQYGHELHFFESHLTSQTTALAAGFSAVCIFIHDALNAEALKALAQHMSKKRTCFFKIYRMR